MSIVSDSGGMVPIPIYHHHTWKWLLCLFLDCICHSIVAGIISSENSAELCKLLEFKTSQRATLRGTEYANIESTLWGMVCIEQCLLGTSNGAARIDQRFPWSSISMDSISDDDLSKHKHW